MPIMAFFRKRASRKIVLQFADTHGGHKLGLMGPGVTLYDQDERGNPVPYSPHLTATQEFLWRCYEEDLAEAEKLASGDPVIIIHNGDLAWGDKYPRQLVSTRKADQVAIAVANIERAMELPNVQAVRLIHGTGAHTFLEGTATILVAEQLKARHPLVDVACLIHGLFDISGVSLDCAHHGPSPGIRNWTAGNQLRYYTRSVMLDALADGEKPPDVLVRAHFHTKRHETVRIETVRGVFKTEAFILPAYSGLSDYGHQVTRSKHRISVGMIPLEIEADILKSVSPLWRTVDLRTKERL